MPHAVGDVVIVFLPVQVDCLGFLDHRDAGGVRCDIGDVMDGRDDAQPHTDSLDLDRMTLPPGPPNRCQASSGNEVG